MEKQMTLEEARKFWSDYETKLRSLQQSDTEMEAAFGVNPHRADAFDRDFWTNVYTPELARSLPESQRYDS